jgi:hypothetical protein
MAVYYEDPEYELSNHGSNYSPGDITGFMAADLLLGAVLQVVAIIIFVGIFVFLKKIILGLFYMFFEYKFLGHSKWGYRFRHSISFRAKK